MGTAALEAALSGVAPESQEAPAEGTPSEQEAAPTETTEVAPAEQEAVEEQPLLAGKYKTVEELERAYAEASTLIGRQSADVAEAKQLRQEFDTLRQQVSQPARQPNYDALLEENAGAAAELAYNSNDQYQVARAVEQWKLEDPFAASVWVANKLRDEEMAKLRADYEVRLAPAQKVAAQNSINEAFAEFSASNPDAGVVLSNLFTKIESGEPLSPAVKLAFGNLQSDTPEGRHAAFETLYALTKVQQSEVVAAATTQTQQRQSEEARAAKVNATVASGAAQPEAPALTNVEQYLTAFEEAAKRQGHMSE